MKPEEEIVELNAKIAYLESQVKILKRNNDCKDIPIKDIEEANKRLSTLENKIAILEHEKDSLGIIKDTSKIPYIPYKSSQPIESMQTPSQWLKSESHTKN
jgi:hypothetical protein